MQCKKSAYIFHAKLLMAWWLCMGHFATVLHAQEPNAVSYGVNNGLSSSKIYCVFQDTKGYMWFGTESGVDRYDGYSFRSFGTADGLPSVDIIDVKEDTSGKIWFIPPSGRVSYFYNNKIFIPRFAGNAPNQRIEAMTFDEKGKMYLSYTDGQIFVLNTSDSSLYKKYLGQTPEGLVYKVMKFVFDGSGSIWGETYTGFCYIRNGELTDKKLAKGSPSSRIRSLSLNDSTLLFASTYGLATISYNSPEKYIRQDFLQLGSNDVFCFMKHSSGNIWIGTKNGVFIFKDTSFSQAPKVYYHDKLISGMMEDKEGNVWLSTLGDGLLFMPSSDFLSWKKQNGLLYDNISAIDGDREGNVWAADEKGNVYRIKDDQIKVYPSRSRFYHPTSDIKALDDGRIMVLTIHEVIEIKGDEIIEHSLDYKEVLYDKGIYYLLPYTFGVFAQPYARIFIPAQEEVRPNIFTRVQRINNIFIKGDSIVVSNYNNGIYLRYKGEERNVMKESDLVKTRITDLEINFRGDIYFCTSAEGVFVIKSNGRIIHLNTSDGLPSDICRSLYIRGKDVWIATNKGACMITEKAEGSFGISNISNLDGIVSNELNDIYVAPGGTVWAGTTAGISKFNPGAHKHKSQEPAINIERITIFSDTLYNTDIAMPHLPYQQRDITFNFTGISFKSRGNISYNVILEGYDTAVYTITSREIKYSGLPAGDYTFKVWAIDKFGSQSATPASFRFIIQKPYWQALWFIIAVIAGILILLTAGFFIIQRYIKQRESRNYEIRRRMNELEVKALRAQMNPHFIFNSLNAIQHLMLKNDRKATNLYLSKFASLMRMILQNSKNNEILLSEELSLLNLYLELELLRFEEKLNFTITVAPDVRVYDTYIPSMLIQPLVENAIKHGLMSKEKNGVIHIEITNGPAGYIKCVVEDNGVGRERAAEIMTANSTAGTSTGLNSVKERLKLYGQRNEGLFTFTDLYDEEGVASGSRVELLVQAITED